MCISYFDSVIGTQQTFQRNTISGFLVDGCLSKIILKPALNLFLIDCLHFESLLQLAKKIKVFNLDSYEIAHL